MSQRILPAFVFSVLLLFINPQSVQAVTCSLRTDPSPIVVPAGRDNLPVGYRIQYNVTVDETGSYEMSFQGFRYFFDNLTRGSDGVLVNSLGQPPNAVISSGNPGSLSSAGTKTIEIKRTNAQGNNTCKVSYTILKQEASKQVDCNISGPSEANSDTEIKYSGTITPEGKYRFNISSSSTNIQTPEFSSDSNGSFPEQNIGRLSSGVYKVTLQRLLPKFDLASGTTNEWWENTSCALENQEVKSSAVLPNPNTTPRQIGKATPGILAPDKSCLPGDPNCSLATGVKIPDCTDDEDNPAIATAIGCIHTSPLELAKDLMKFVIGIGGGFAFLFMVIGAFQMITSAGNPDSLHTGRERFTSAIIGLLIVIFAILLFEIIGFDILRIPGFGK